MCFRTTDSLSIPDDNGHWLHLRRGKLAVLCRAIGPDIQVVYLDGDITGVMSLRIQHVYIAKTPHGSRRVLRYHVPNNDRVDGKKYWYIGPRYIVGKWRSSGWVQQAMVWKEYDGYS